METVKEHVLKMANTLEESARMLRIYADKIIKDIDYSQEVISEISNLYIALRLPVFIARIIRSKNDRP